MNRQSGQILLIVILSMVVALTIGLSVASRTISNLRISKQNEESQRAFQAAEAGVERAVSQLQNNQCTGNSQTGCTIGETDLPNDARFEAQITVEQGNSIVLNGSDYVEQGVGLDVWMSNFPDFSNPFTGRVRFSWGTGSQECTGSDANKAPALELLLLYGDRANPSVHREVFDPCPLAPSRISGATAATVGNRTIENINFKYSAVFPNTSFSNMLVIKANPIYNSTVLALERDSGSPIIPAQGSTVTSTGVYGETVRKIEYFRSYPQIPNELFPYAIIGQQLEGVN